MTELTTQKATPGASETIAELAEEAWQQYILGQPIEATALGDRRFDDRLRPNAPGDVAHEAEVMAAIGRRAQALDPAQLSPPDRTTRSALLDFVAYVVQQDEAGIETWMVDPLDGPQVAFLNIPAFQSVDTPADSAALLGRWRAMGPWVDNLTSTTRSALKQGVVAPRALVRSVVDELEDLLARPDGEWPLLEPGRKAGPDWPAGAAARFTDDLEAAVRDGIRPAFARYRAFLVDEVAPLARPDDRAGLAALPGGAEMYRRLARSHTTLELEPDAIHHVGLEETARIDEEIEALGSRILGSSDRPTILARLRSDPALQFATSAEVLGVAEASLGRANDAIPTWFGRLPDAPCVVVEMGAHEAKHSTIAYYREPAADGSRPGSYYVNTTEPTTRPRYEAEVLAFHESVPGHHLQIAIAQELEGLPTFRRLTGPTAFIEGWGLYTERLATEMGLLSGELDQFGVLSFDAWRACRLVVDTGLHAMGWGREQAIRFMVEHTALAENNIANEVDRYLAMPGQALAYKLGQLEIVRLREASRSRLGRRFDIRSFHDAVLGQGALGLPTLEQVIEEWIEERREPRGRAAGPDQAASSG